jgi:ribonuclease HI
MFTIYTDGSCIKNPNGPGGWACYIIDGYGMEFILSGGEKSTTNNRMELRAVIESLKFLKDKDSCKIYSDSMLTINCASGKWKRKANLDMWDEYNIASTNKCITFEWVKGHSGNKYNEIVDKLALQESQSNK